MTLWSGGIEAANEARERLGWRNTGAQNKRTPSLFRPGVPELIAHIRQVTAWGCRGWGSTRSARYQAAGCLVGGGVPLVSLKGKARRVRRHTPLCVRCGVPVPRYIYRAIYIERRVNRRDRNVRMLLALIYVLTICCVGAGLFVSVNKSEPNHRRLLVLAVVLRQLQATALASVSAKGTYPSIFRQSLRIAAHQPSRARI